MNIYNKSILFETTSSGLDNLRFIRPVWDDYQVPHCCVRQTERSMDDNDFFYRPVSNSEGPDACLS